MSIVHLALPNARAWLVPVCLLASLLSPWVWAQEEGVAEPEPSPAALDFEPTFSATLKQLGADYVMNLRGVEGSDSVPFDIRADQVVTDARLNLEYSYSPALIPELSQLNVMVNNQVAVSLPLPKETAGSVQRQTVQIPAYLITDFNRLTLQLIGHYTMQCEDPLNTSLWAKVNNSSELQIKTTPLQLPNDLALLPQPLFDSRDSRLLELPFVFAGARDARTLEAASAVASWFGALASYRKAHFPVQFNDLPAQGNAVLFRIAAQPVAGLSDEPVTAPTLSLQSNPNDPYGKLLIISGRDSEQLKQAAQALVMGSHTLNGEQAQVGPFEKLQPRKPYDAPNWLPSDRPVQLGALIDPKKMSVSGYDPGTINLPMRLPPDLFHWREDGVPLRLKYRYTPQPQSTNSSLLISVSGKFIKSLPLPSQERLKDDQTLMAKLQQDDSLLREATLRIPLDRLPLQSSLQLRFMYDFIKQGECRDIIIDNMRGTIEPDSSIDLSGYKHFIGMPNLGVFQSSGFPFTRMADLSETAVVMPSEAGAQDISALLDVVGGFGESTGLPATALSVVSADDEAAMRGKDLLVLASGDNQPLLKRWAQYLPASLGGTARFELSDLVHRVQDWVGSDPQVNLQKARSSLSLSDGSVNNYLAGFESPLDRGRSVVVIAARQPADLDVLTTALRGGEEYEQSIQGSLAVVNDKRINSLVADEQYYVGELGWFRYVQWRLAHSLGWMLLITALGVLLASVCLYATLKARARSRLKGSE
ncbi:Cyclic di-GMP-binding protein [Pseudomonas sp. 8Z]|uniref:cellulose biosynthesis cyclic di-GMP-binding regulatory protein BcsB n=1 Tax=Pseudomonas sp. 8Z TaxID=2653166 RepID=UPI0012F1C1B7|nr:cellulose biosynthesis cyclic di-GMP-binding regulatory protein BcsB [Pseudomonas sp. 8Z]VXC43884.1 Cyclic di-GMP-binding protein [Pseudomonas sp. 8Z]